MPKLKGIVHTFILSLFVFSCFLFIAKAAPWLGFGTLPVKQLVNMTGSIGEYNNRFYSIALTPSMIGLVSNPNNDYQIKSNILNYGWGNCSIDPYTVQKMLSGSTIRSLLTTTRFFLTCPRDSDVFSGNQYNPIAGAGDNSNPYRNIGELSTATTVKAKTCADYFNTVAGNSNLLDGIYMIDPDGVGGNNAINVYCDMTTEGGGWTLVGYAGDKSVGFPTLASQQGTYNALTRTGAASINGAVLVAKLSNQMSVAFHSNTNITGNMGNYNDAIAIQIPNPSVVTFSTSTMGTCQTVSARRILPVGSTNKCVGNGVGVGMSAANCGEVSHTPALYDQSLGARWNGFGYGVEEKESSCDSFSNVHHKVFVGSHGYNWAPSNTRSYNSITDGSASIWLR